MENDKFVENIKLTYINATGDYTLGETVKKIWQTNNSTNSLFKGMKNYYNGLISYYKNFNNDNFPKIKYNFIALDNAKYSTILKYESTKIVKKNKKNEQIEEDDDDEGMLTFKKKPYFLNERNKFNNAKINWIVEFMKEHKNEKTLIYLQYLDPIYDLHLNLIKNDINCDIVDGSLSSTKKQDIVNKYNNNEVTCLIFSYAIKEGISFKETKNFIYAQPYWNYAITEQIIARAIRSDSHKLKNKDNINIYFPMFDTRFDILQQYAKIYNYIFNNIGIEQFRNYKQLPDDIYRDSDDISNYSGGYDIYMYTRMIEKQIGINEFQNILLNDVPSMEASITTESNEFITCCIVPLYEEPAGFCDVSLTSTICIKSFVVTPEAKVLSVNLWYVTGITINTLLK